MGLFVLKENNYANLSIEEICESIVQDALDNNTPELINENEFFIRVNNVSINEADNNDKYIGKTRFNIIRDNSGNEYLGKSKYYHGDDGWKQGITSTAFTKDENTVEPLNKYAEYARNLDKATDKSIIARGIRKFRSLYQKILMKLKLDKVRQGGKNYGVLKKIAHFLLNTIDKLSEKLQRMAAGVKQLGKVK